jgi:hypothetical protein
VYFRAARDLVNSVAISLEVVEGGAGDILMKEKDLRTQAAVVLTVVSLCNLRHWNGMRRGFAASLLCAGAWIRLEGVF